MTNEQKINLIGQKILLLSNQIDLHRNELDSLRRELEALKAQTIVKPVQNVVIPPVQEPVVEKKPDPIVQPPPPVIEPEKPIEQPVLHIEEPVTPPVQPIQQPVQQQQQPPQRQVPAQPQNINLEERIGSKVFSIIGIIALVLGVSIGVKYAIDKDLINETGRLVLGYMAGIVLLGFAFFYKKKYEVFSSILLSGAMAIMYYTTYVGYAYYHKYPPAVAFGIMALFTGFTVFAAHIYNYEVIALIGLVGGYALPPLLSTGSGEIQYMFGFMLILNLGVLALSFIKYWKFVNHVAYGLTWLIFVGWMLSAYSPDQYFGRAMFFSTAFFIIFYLSFIAYKLFRNKPFSVWDIILVLSNSMIYFAVGYNILTSSYDSATHYEDYQGLFCVLNALIHLGFALLCRKKELADKIIFYLILVMVISFLTMAVPIQLDGNYVTVIWFTEMLLLIWMWKRFRSTVYFVLAFIMSALAFVSLVHDWANSYMDDIRYLLPLLTNRYFCTGVFGLLAYWIGWSMVRKSIQQDESRRGIASAFKFILLGFALVTTYVCFESEMMLFFDQSYHFSLTKINGSYGYTYDAADRSWKTYQGLWFLLYTSFFVVLTGLVNERFFRSKVAAYIAWGFTGFTLLIAMVFGFPLLEALRPEHHTNDSNVFVETGWNHGFRYLYYVGLAGLIAMLYRFRHNEDMKPLRILNTCLFHIAILVLLSAELTNQFVSLNSSHVNYDAQASYYRKVSYRMGYTVLWGLYSMALISYGIIRGNKTLRILAMSLFGLTILKLAIDAISMSAGYRLIVFITIGIILLLVSFLYQKFKTILFGSDAAHENHETNV